MPSEAIGGLSHSKFRNFENDRKSGEYRKFIDGDLVESFLDLTPRQMGDVVKIMADDGWLLTYFDEDDEDEKAEEARLAMDSSDSSNAPEPKLTVGGVIHQVESMARRH